MKSIQKQSTLAINGGTPVLRRELPEPHNMSGREVAAAVRVIKRGPLSGFLGTASERFLGGKEVRAFEAEFAKKFKVKHAVAFNSATTALHAAIVSLGIGPGDEVITTPYTMSATVMAVLQNGAVPIFADIDPRTFNIDPVSVERCVTKYTKAILVVNLFGQPADFGPLLRIAKKYKLKIIEDNAQGPGAKWKGRYTGTIGDVGVFSLNVHKTMQTGEGGMLVTDNPRAALRAQLCRNHGEAVVEGIPDYSAGPVIGSNYRMSEVLAAMARIQLKRLEELTKKRLILVKRLERGLRGIPGLTPPYVAAHSTSVYYRYPLLIDEKKLGLSRDVFAKAMQAEGFRVPAGYLTPLHLLPVFLEQRAFNKTHFPFKSNYYKGSPKYGKGVCPVVERINAKEFTLTDICQHPYTTRHVDLFLRAVRKVLSHKQELQ